jgi:hypothetical protein
MTEGFIVKQDAATDGTPCASYSYAGSPGEKGDWLDAPWAARPGNRDIAACLSPCFPNYGKACAGAVDNDVLRYLSNRDQSGNGLGVDPFGATILAAPVQPVLEPAHGWLVGSTLVLLVFFTSPSRLLLRLGAVR